MELHAKLRACRFDADRVESVLAALDTENLQSDSRFSEQFIHSRAERGFGPVKIRHQLRERGIDDGLVKALLDLDHEDWRRRASTERRKKFGVAPPDGQKERALQTRFLEYRGFTAKQIKGALDSDEET